MPFFEVQNERTLKGATLEGIEAIRVVGGALEKLAVRGIVAPEDFPLMRHLYAVVANGEPLNMPWNTFFSRAVQKRAR